MLSQETIYFEGFLDFDVALIVSFFQMWNTWVFIDLRQTNLRKRSPF
jgi:hypothetical protein